MRNLWFVGGLAIVILLSACGQVISPPDDVVAADLPKTDEATEINQPAPEPTATPTIEALTETPLPEPTATPDPAEEPTPLPEPTQQTEPREPEEEPPAFAEAEFSTDFSIHSVPYSEILSGGPPKDGIPAIDNPVFVSVPEADEWLQPQEPVVFFQIDEDARAYPIQILMWHEIVNDVVSDVPVVITFCPLCNTAIAFERTFDGQILDFGTSGRLRFSNLIMYDRQTETWWQQASGEAIVGRHTGSQLNFLPASITGWGEFKSAHPDGIVLSRETGFSRPYGNKPL